MFIRQCFRRKDGKRHAYWALVESYRSERGPRQRVVAWLGKLDESGRLGVLRAARGKRSAFQQRRLFEEKHQRAQAEWVEIDAASVRVENCRDFGGPWVAMALVERLKLDQFLSQVIRRGRARIPWSLSALILIIARLLKPSSELYTSEQWYPKTALPDLLGVPADRVDDNRLYRTLDELLPHKEALEIHLKKRMGELFELQYDLLLYDITSTYFEGEAKFSLAQRGYSRDQRGDCKQVCIGLVVSRCGIPLGYEVFAGNTADVTTVENIIETMEKRYGKSDRIWVMDRGMISEENLAFLREGNRRYIVGTPKSMLKKFEQPLLNKPWKSIRDGLEVKLCSAPSDDDQQPPATPSQPETFILCRSRDRMEKDAAIVGRFEQRIEERLSAMAIRCEKQHRQPMKVEREVGRLLGQNARAAHLFDVSVESTDQGCARLRWKKKPAAMDWHTLSCGCYLLRSNVIDWSDEELWKAYIQLTEAEAAFRIHKSDLSIRPIWHQKQDRVLAHILVCFLAYVLWKTLAQLCEQAGLGSEPRRVLAELSEIRLIDVVLPTRRGIEIRKRCVTRPTDHQHILLQRLGLQMPTNITQSEM